MAEDRFLKNGFPELYARGLLEEDSSSEFEVHLLDCDQCYKEYELAERYIRSLKQLAGDPVFIEGAQDEHSRLANIRMIILQRPIPALAAALIPIAVVVAWYFLLHIPAVHFEEYVTQLCDTYQRGEGTYLPLDSPGVAYRGDESHELVSIAPGPDNLITIFFHDPRGGAHNRLNVQLVSIEHEIAADSLIASNLPGIEPAVYGMMLDAQHIAPGMYRLIVYSRVEGTSHEIGSTRLLLDK